MTRVIQAGTPQRSLKKSGKLHKKGITPAKDSECIQYLDAIATFQQSNPDSNLTPRDRLTLAALSALAIQRKEETDPHLMVAASLLQLACLGSLSLSERKFDVQPVPDVDAYKLRWMAFASLQIACLRLQNLRVTFENVKIRICMTSLMAESFGPACISFKEISFHKLIVWSCLAMIC